MGFLSRHLRLLFLTTALVVAAFSTGLTFLFFLVYLTAAILIGSWLYARRGLREVRADYRVLNPRTHVGEVLQAVYRVENHDWVAKPWVELWNESTLPSSLPGRVVGMPGHGRRQWMAKVTLTRRGSYRLGALRVRTGDPFGLFTSEMLIGHATSVVVFPEVVELPNWRLPPSPIDGTTRTRRRYEAATPLVSTVRPYVHGDAINRIHWLSSARHAELHVKEFDLEQAADLWIALDLERAVHAGVGTDASVETAVTIAASIALRTLGDNRAVAMTASARRMQVHQPDRGPRVEQKLLHLLANVQADGAVPLAEVINATLTQLRRGMTLCIVTGSTDRTWVRGLSVLRRRGVGALVILLDRSSYISDEPDDQSRAELAAVRHALSEYGVEQRLVRRGDDIAEALGGPGARPCLSSPSACATHGPAGSASSCLGSWRSRSRGRSRARSGSTRWTSSSRWRCPPSSPVRSSACCGDRSCGPCRSARSIGTGIVLWTVGGEYLHRPRPGGSADGAAHRVRRLAGRRARHRLPTADDAVRDRPRRADVRDRLRGAPSRSTATTACWTPSSCSARR